MIARKGMLGWTLMGLCVCLALLAPAMQAGAQSFGMASMMRPAVTSEEMDALLTIVDADEAQESVIRDLFQSLMQKHETASDRLREILDRAKEEAQQDPTVWQDIQGKFIEFYGYKEKLSEGLFDDILLVLSAEQAERWPAFMRYHRRQHLLDDQQSIVSAARVDLSQVLEDVSKEDDAPEPEGIDDLRDRYETELDRLLIEKKELTFEQLERTAELLKEGKNWMALMPQWEEMFVQGRELQIKIRDVNEKYVRQLSMRLSETLSTEFEREYNRRAMPRVYEKTYADKAFEAAKGIESLSDEQREHLQVLQEEYERSADAIRVKWAGALRDWQSDVAMMDLFGGQKSGGDESKTLGEEKKDLDERYYERVRSVLDEEQQAALPERETDWRRSEGGFGD